MAYLIRNTPTEAAPAEDKPLVPAFFRRFSQETVLFVGLLLYRLRHGRKAVRLDKAAKKTGGAA